MELFATILIMNALIAFVRFLNRSREARVETLCVFCSFAHVQYGANGRRAISCTYGGGVRGIKLDVLYCTDYRDRNAPPRVVRVGFVPAIEPAESSTAA
jgi:hypothetical protein